MKKLRRNFGIGMLALVMSGIGFIGCSDDNDVVPSEPINLMAELSADGQEVVDAYSDFALKSFLSLRELKGDVNFVYSPATAAFNLSMIANAAEGETRQQIMDALMPGGSIQLLNDVNSAILSTFGSNASGYLSLANSLWVNHNSTIKNEFATDMNNLYKCPVTNVDFANKNDIQKINDWTSKQTSGKINDISSSFNSPNISFAFLNSLYYKSGWKGTFDPQDTKDRYFYLESGNTATTKIMKGTIAAAVKEYDNFVVASLGMDGGFSFDVILPNKDISLSQITDELKKGFAIPNFSTGTDEIEGLKVFLPIMDLSAAKFNIIDMLLPLGIRNLTTPQLSDMSNMTNGSVWLSIFEQYNSLKVNEKGAEAASTTVSTFDMMNFDPYNKTLNCNHPFIYMIREKSTGLILMMGQYMHP